MKEQVNQSHSSAWVIQTWLSFLISISVTSIGIFYMPVDPWVKAFMGMGLLFSVGSTVSLTKTQRDLHESTRMISKLEEAKLEKILAEHNHHTL
ncbi:YiaAB two helix domain-containing protein [Cyanobacterium stanieri PCC 7202]|uniref:YiaAB two helix domain-containing protein n=1 Tax=Cyanobacterium stanieri (strain ATCC 29140 / PCC 7202) TaxID=292563 RepID=K9YGZ3_CYASC|nr:YiaAB two helix domain-containing protein [Cyanobacterium stanieri PCC 7202]